jgi:tetratricopeptide (TPR) repeat protein
LTGSAALQTFAIRGGAITSSLDFVRRGTVGLFNRFKRQAVSPIGLRERLLQAVQDKDWKTFLILCQQHREDIRHAFPLWQKATDVDRDDPAAVNRYGEGMVAVAQWFEHVGDPSLLTLLTGNEADNDLFVWQKDLVAAKSLVDSGQLSEAIGLLQSTLGRTKELKGTAVDYYLPRTCGLLGVACFRSGDKDRAIEFTQKALALCEQSGDQEGISAYKGNLQYMEEGATTILRDPAGRVLSWEQLRDMTGPIRWEIVGHTNKPPEANLLHQEARQAGSIGDYVSALAKLEKASKMAPDWPYPVYDTAFTYLLMKDFDKSRTFYRKTLEMAPRGFFTAITALHTLLREENGELPVGTYLAYLSLEEMDRAERLEATRVLVEHLPNFAPAWKDFAILSEGKQRLAAIENGLAASPDPETKGILEINKAMILDGTGDHDGAVRLLEKLALDPTSTFGTEQFSKSLLANFLKR